jgi:hypothetical protein
VPDTPAPPESWVPNDRFYVQLALGQIHGVLHRAVLDAKVWLSQMPENVVNEALAPDDLVAAYVEACKQVGTIQAALNTGTYDESLASVGYSGGQLRIKLKGLWHAVRRYAGAATSNIKSYLARMQDALGWSGTIVGSVSKALEKEITHIPGASAAAEGLKEFIEVLQHAAKRKTDVDEN